MTHALLVTSFEKKKQRETKRPTMAESKYPEELEEKTGPDVDMGPVSLMELALSAHTICPSSGVDAPGFSGPDFDHFFRSLTSVMYSTAGPSDMAKIMLARFDWRRIGFGVPDMTNAIVDWYLELNKDIPRPESLSDFVIPDFSSVPLTELRTEPNFHDFIPDSRWRKCIHIFRTFGQPTPSYPKNMIGVLGIIAELETFFHLGEMREKSVLTKRKHSRKGPVTRIYPVRFSRRTVTPHLADTFPSFKKNYKNIPNEEVRRSFPEEYRSRKKCKEQIEFIGLLKGRTISRYLGAYVSAMSYKMVRCGLFPVLGDNSMLNKDFVSTVFVTMLSARDRWSYEADPFASPMFSRFISDLDMNTGTNWELLSLFCLHPHFTSKLSPDIIIAMERNVHLLLRIWANVLERRFNGVRLGFPIDRAINSSSQSKQLNVIIEAYNVLVRYHTMLTDMSGGYKLPIAPCVKLIFKNPDRAVARFTRGRRAGRIHRFADPRITAEYTASMSSMRQKETRPWAHLVD